MAYVRGRSGDKRCLFSQFQIVNTPARDVESLPFESNQKLDGVNLKWPLYFRSNVCDESLNFNCRIGEKHCGLFLLSIQFL
ncbi:hypothetical protein I3843_05G066900 [Carya illinoinensis]|nr:hypothetical protein I3843_05G066900 [Carya illinoinensis]